MKRQTHLDNYIKKKLTNRDIPKTKAKYNYIDLLPQVQQEQVKLEVYSKKFTLVCCQMKLITPVNLIFYEHNKHIIRRITEAYSKQSMQNYIENNLSFKKISNISNLLAIEDEQFWNVSMKKVINKVYSSIDSIGDISLLRKNENKYVELTRLQVLCIMFSMFVGIMPAQYHQSLTSFGYLMTFKDNEKVPENVILRRNKLKFFMNYFHQMAKSKPSFDDEKIIIQRVVNRNQDYLSKQKLCKQMCHVDFKNLTTCGIEDYYCQAIMVDFSNIHVGGDVLKNGSSQEQIMFSIFPEAIVSQLLCEDMGDQQAIIIYGAKRFSMHQGFLKKLQFVGAYQEDNENENENSANRENSIIVAIDATDFSERNHFQSNQFSKKAIRRQIHKAFTGFQFNYLQKDKTFPVCTGKWGCGIFKGDEDLKFLIQWIACSQAQRQMIYIAENKQKCMEYTFLVNQFITLGMHDILSILEDFCRFKATVGPTKKTKLIDYIKNIVI